MPDRTGYSLRDVRAFARHRGASRRIVQLAAGERGAASSVWASWTCRCATTSTVRRSSWGSTRHRRRGVGRAIVAHGGAGGRRGPPIAQRPSWTCRWRWPRRTRARPSPAASASRPRCPGTAATSACPWTRARADELRAVVRGARDADAYRTLTWVAPWPADFVEDHCELQRRMSTDEPPGDGDKEEEVWDRQRISEEDELLEARGVWKLTAVAQHVGSGRLVAFSELLLSPDAPAEAWQLATSCTRPPRAPSRPGREAGQCGGPGGGGARGRGAS